MVFYVILQILITTPNIQVLSSGYDAYTSCYRTSRKYPELPCDFGKQTWCNIPGNAYPWHAVRRFVHENQGLMRRMYGDERHMSVLRAEIENGDEFNDFNNLGQDFQNRYKRPREFTKSVKKKQNKIRKSINLEIRSQNGFNNHNYIQNEDKNLYVPSSNFIVDKVKDSATTTNNHSSAVFNDTTTTKEYKNETSTLPTTQSIDTTTINTTVQTESQVPSSDPLPTTTNASSYEMEDFDYTSEGEEATTTTTTPEEGLTTTTDEFEDEEMIEDDEMYDDTTVEGEEEAVEEPVSQAPPVIKLKGINACPVKEEVVAPFWANNTRGEVLALLNLYPFEQYVHWEKCTYEHKQMFCRDGCRCEQQYRLHRLLAYDPNNECRGIFSDWFRFPSCCVCKCYDIPMEFRLTSRSPRKQTLVKDIYKKNTYNRFNLKN